jgi:hypothetical protein
MPFKVSAAQRHRIPKARHRVRNGRHDDRGLVRRGDIRVWLSKAAVAGGRGGVSLPVSGMKAASPMARASRRRSMPGPIVARRISMSRPFPPSPLQMKLALFPSSRASASLRPK